MKIGIVGCGAIGAEVARVLASGALQGLELVALHDVNVACVEALASSLNASASGKNAVKVLSLEGLVEAVDLLVQATAADSMPDITRKALMAKCHVLALSAGGLAKAPELAELAEKEGCHIYVPSGAIAGIDAVLAAREAGLTAVSLTTTKHPRSLVGAPYLTKHGLQIESIDRATTIFEGSAREAIEGFPANSNVAITLSFAGLGMDATQVRIIADPAALCTRHEIYAEGATGKITAITECTVSAINPKTSLLATMSALALLRSLGVALRLGT